MKHLNLVAALISRYVTALFVFPAIFAVGALKGQAVTEIITDYNGYFKTGSAAVNTVKPDNHHNLLAFRFNGIRYSTGVNDHQLSANGESFTPARFRALPMNGMTGTATSNTKIGWGAMADGVYNGGGQAPHRGLAQYLNDGPNGLNLGTCVANLPVGTMFMSVSNLQASNIGDGIPDIVVTQVADPSTRYDRYSFTDINGNTIGNFLDIVLTNITPVGQWVADFYEATGSTVLQSGFTQTQRNLRLWAADFSAFGINASNIGNIAYFKINLSGDSDIAFVAYNTTTVTVNQVLSLPSGNERQQRPVRSEGAEEIKIFPNPAHHTFTIQHPKADGREEILLYNSSGILLKRQFAGRNAVSTSMDISSLPRGLYTVCFKNGITDRTEKLLVN